jgi:hypothetical protein
MCVYCMTSSESPLTLSTYHTSIDLITLFDCLTAALPAQVSNDSITQVRAVLDSAGLQHVEVWESERAFIANGWDYRCSNHTQWWAVRRAQHHVQLHRCVGWIARSTGLNTGRLDTSSGRVCRWTRRFFASALLQ